MREKQARGEYADLVLYRRHMRRIRWASPRNRGGIGDQAGRQGEGVEYECAGKKAYVNNERAVSRRSVTCVSCDFVWGEGTGGGRK